MPRNAIEADLEKLPAAKDPARSASIPSSTHTALPLSLLPLLRWTEQVTRFNVSWATRVGSRSQVQGWLTCVTPRNAG